MANNENLSNSIWPNGIKTNSEGYAIFYPLGTNKISVPSTAEEWPAGNKLISPFVYQDDKLVGFCDTKAMTVSGQTSITLNYEHIEADFSSIEEGMLTITAPNATTTKYIWANSSSSDTGNSGDTIVTLKYKGCTTIAEVKAVDPDYKTNDIVDGVWEEGLGDLEQGGVGGRNGGMFINCSNLTSFTSDLSSMTDGICMFYGCFNLTSFSADLSSLTSGIGMFYNCSNLTSFSSTLPNLTDGENMFYQCFGLTSFNTDLSSLWNGDNMFWHCSNLTSFSADLSNLTNGDHMFNGCENLTSFSSVLPNLTNGTYMFDGCKLDTASVQNIADTINTPPVIPKKTIHIGIGNTTPNEQEETAFNTIAFKNWTVYVNGSKDSNIWNPTATTPIDGEQTVTPIPFYAKPVQSDEKHARYVDENGNYYNILGGNYIYGDSLENYGMFISEEDAAANMRLTKIERN
jgi:hypothetical protein